jgi:hypothetical protein
VPAGQKLRGGQPPCGSGTSYFRSGTRGLGRQESGICPAGEAFSDVDVWVHEHPRLPVKKQVFFELIVFWFVLAGCGYQEEAMTGRMLQIARGGCMRCAGAEVGCEIFQEQAIQGACFRLQGGAAVAVLGLKLLPECICCWGMNANTR